jgi:3-hydroxyacyl-CoA dehydrogenase/enoyl-CoA hydratase/3-hydroxybutyryl-CoA epimerase
MELTNWKLTGTPEGLAWLVFDRAGAATNTFSSEALRELGRIADHLASMPPKGLAILSAKDNGFAAGADIDEFTALKSEDEAIALTVLGNEVYDKIERLPFPTVAMIHGFCMGGGLELALACRYRIADDGPKTRMALPEVMLGIVPGWGGARRLPRLIGAAAALDLMLTGARGRRPAREEARPRRRRHAASPFRERRAHDAAAKARAARARACRDGDRLAAGAQPRRAHVREEGRRARAP